MKAEDVVIGEVAGKGLAADDEIVAAWRAMREDLEHIAFNYAIPEHLLHGGAPKGLSSRVNDPKWEPEPYLHATEYLVSFGVRGAQCDACGEDLSGKASVHENKMCGKSWCFSCSRKRSDAPNYGGWSEGDVLAELDRWGCAPDEDPPTGWRVIVGKMFDVHVDWCFGRWRAELKVIGDCKDATVAYRDTLPEAMAWAVERWRELVAESDPTPQGEAPCSHDDGGPVTRTGVSTAGRAAGPLRQIRGTVLTGDLGQRTEFGAGWHDWEEK